MDAHSIADERGPVEMNVAQDLTSLGELDGLRPSLAQLALSLARALDQDPGVNTAAVARELRTTLLELAQDGSDSEGTEAILEQLRAPVEHSAKPAKGNARRPRSTGGENTGDAVDAVAASRSRRRSRARS